MYTNTASKQNKIVEHKVGRSYDNMHSTFTVLCEKSKIVSFDSSIMKNVACPVRSRSPVELIGCIDLGPVLSVCDLLKSIAIYYCYYLIIIFKIIIV